MKPWVHVIKEKLQEELDLYRKANSAADDELVRHHLARAHILSQSSTLTHLYIHVLMFSYACKKRDFPEVAGQILRLIVTIPGHLFGKVPQGNIGWSTVKLTVSMPIPEDLKKYIR